jgi:arylsulfatase A-like enzyme
MDPLDGPPPAAAPAPNVVLVVADDLGFSDPGCYGGEIRTAPLDRLAREGVRLSQFYTSARCSPSRASLLTGLHPQQVGLGILTNDEWEVTLEIYGERSLVDEAAG